MEYRTEWNMDYNKEQNMEQSLEKVTLLVDTSEDERVGLGREYLEAALLEAGCQVYTATADGLKEDYRNIEGKKLYLGVEGESAFLEFLKGLDLLLYHTKVPEGEGFYVGDLAGNLTVVSGGSPNGVLYGALSLEEKIRERGGMPEETDFSDAPAFLLRGPAIGLQKTKIEPPRLTYEYPITPERFPWFYDRELWTRLLDRLLRQRCNILYLWTGHPFSSLIRMPQYPEALEVTEEELQKNREIFGWLTRECHKRGIWVVLKFYSIHIPYPFAMHHGLDQHQSDIHPLVADYTRKAIAQFIASYPHIGLMVCLGEALRGNENKTRWFTETILPGVKDGVKRAGLKEHPPIILRGHACDPQTAMTEGRKVYDKIYTMWKYNGEGLTTWQPRGKWQTIHEDLSSLTDIHIINVHILADLEPFRYAHVSFIRKCVQASRYRLGANGLHLYPLFFWDWPYSPDRTQERLLQLDRDFLWYQAWFRYAWNPDREEGAERCYWKRELARYFGCDDRAAGLLLDGLAAAGECAPRILRRVGITEGNRQTFSLGMTMSQFTNVTRYKPNYELWFSVAPQGEQPDEFVRRELEGKIHVGETPEELIGLVRRYGERAERLIMEAGEAVTRNREEYDRYLSDARAIRYLTLFYCEKLEAALYILFYKYTMDASLKGNLSYLEKARLHMEKSLEWYRELTVLTKNTYEYANSMQTKQRKIPFPDGERYGHWEQCLPEYEREYANFTRHLKELREGRLPDGIDAFRLPDTYPQAAFTLLSKDCETYRIEKGESVFCGDGHRLEFIARELMGLTGIRFKREKAEKEGQKIVLDLSQDSVVMVGYFHSANPQWLQVPDLETDTHADDRGGLTPVILNGIKAANSPVVDIHAFHYESGIHEIYLGTGAFLVAGILPEETSLVSRDAQAAGAALENLDWMYED